MTEYESCKTYLNNIVTNEICHLLRLPLPTYVDFIKQMKPTFICPLRNGTYHISDFEIKNTLERYMPRDPKWRYYLITFTGFSEKTGRQLLCFQLILYTKMTKSNK